MAGSIPEELSEPFIHKGRSFAAGFTEYDVKSERGISPGGHSRALHLLVDDDDAALMSEMDEVTRVKSGRVYEIKGIFLSGNGLSEIDLALAQEKPLVRTY